MAKKAKVEPVEQEPEKTVTEAETGLREPNRGEKADLVRKILDEYPHLGNKELAERFNLEAQKLGVNMREQETGPTFAGEKTKRKQTGPSNGRAGASASASVGKKRHEPSMSQLLRVREAVNEYPNLADFERDFDFMQGLVAELGSPEAVKECLRFWGENGVK